MSRTAPTDYPVHDLIKRRWSPYSLDPDKAVSREDLTALFEAARWAASSYNEQPWRYIVVMRDQAEEFAKLLECLAEPNQPWAQNAAVLALGITRNAFSYNGKPNRVAQHDLGAASCSLTFEATARGLAVHQMAGIDPEKIIATYNVPDDFTPQTALAIGYAASPERLPDVFEERDTVVRTRKPHGEFVFWGTGNHPW